MEAADLRSGATACVCLSVCLFIYFCFWSLTDGVVSSMCLVDNCWCLSVCFGCLFERVGRLFVYSS